MGKDILLVDFNVLMNYDYAIWSTYRILNNLEPLKPCKEVYVQLENRERLEPLSIELPSLSDEELFNMKNNILENHLNIVYDNLITNTNIFQVVNACKHNDMVEVTVCCKNEIEEQICKEIFGFCTILDHEVKYNVFDTFMVGTIDRVTSNMKRYLGKCVYLVMARYNLVLLNGNLVLPKDFIELILDKVNIRLIGLFNNKK